MLGVCKIDDSLRGILIVLTVAGLFITCILNFIVIFPQEQGISFNEQQGSNTYLTINSTKDIDTSNTLTTLNNQSENAFNQWDVTTGFMGTNQLKQGQGEIKTYSNNIFSNLRIIATQLFGANSPILYAIGVLALLSSGYIIYLIVQFVRTGR